MTKKKKDFELKGVVKLKAAEGKLLPLHYRCKVIHITEKALDIDFDKCGYETKHNIRLALDAGLILGAK